MARSPLTPARRARLDKLATYLESLPKRYRHFGMAEFVGGVADGDALIRYAAENGGVTSCGTVACAVGHGPAAGVLAPLSVVKKFQKARCIFERADGWFAYARLFVGPETGCKSAFEWCFGGSWVSHDDGHRGAAARIRYLLDQGSPPQGFLFGAGKWKRLYAPYRIDAKAQADA